MRQKVFITLGIALLYGWILYALKDMMLVFPKVRIGAVALALPLGILGGWFWLPNSIQLRLWKTRTRILEKLRWARWICVAVVILGYLWFTVFSPFASLFFDIWVLRWWAFLLVTSALIIFVPRSESLPSWREWSFSLLVVATLFFFAERYALVSNHPFPFYWSESNRFWDYSTIFGRERYLYPRNKPIPVFNDPGRTLLFGLIFLYPGTNISLARFWREFLFTFPYLAFAWMLFRTSPSNKRSLAVLLLGGYLFLNQGPIYPPLVFAAMLVWWAFRIKNGWKTFFLLFLAGYLVRITRFTWTFAPFLWMLSLLLLDEGWRFWRQKSRAAWVMAPLLGALGLHALLPGDRFVSLLSRLEAPGGVVFLKSHETFGALTPQALWKTLTYQSFLWYRLWPNPSFLLGLLPGVVLGTFPLLLLLFLGWRRGWWSGTDEGWKFAFFLTAVFFAVGTMISLKIGGGDNLHNYDMYLIYLLLLTGFIGSHRLISLWNQKVLNLRWVALGILLGPIVVSSTYGATLKSQIISYRQLKQIFQDTNSYYREVLLEFQSLVAQYADKEILFMDFRHFLTFGYVPKVPLIPEYDKKFLMDRALSQHEETFQAYYNDLKEQRFDLIVTEVLKERLISSQEDDFAEENNAWVIWVVRPTLCYYTPIATWTEANLQVLRPRPRADTTECDNVLPLRGTP